MTVAQGARRRRPVQKSSGATRERNRSRHVQLAAEGIRISGGCRRAATRDMSSVVSSPVPYRGNASAVDVAAVDEDAYADGDEVAGVLSVRTGPSGEWRPRYVRVRPGTLSISAAKVVFPNVVCPTFLFELTRAGQGGRAIRTIALNGCTAAERASDSAGRPFALNVTSSSFGELVDLAAESSSDQTRSVYCS